MKVIRCGLRSLLLAIIALSYNGAMAADAESTNTTGTEDQPWVMADETMEPSVEIYPETDAELRAATKGVRTRGVMDDQAKIIVEGQGIFLDIMRDMAKALPIKSTGCDRDDLMATNAMIILGAAAMVPGLTTIGAGAGTIIGGVGGGIAATPTGAIPGAVPMGIAGGVTGSGVGFTAGAAQFGVVGLYVSNNVRDIYRTTEPCGGSAGVSKRSASTPLEPLALEDDVDEAQYWVDFAEEEVEPVATGVQERAARQSSRRATSIARPTTRYAGQYESLYVHIIKALYTNKVYNLSQNWERSSAVPSSARAFLSNPTVRQRLKPAVDLIAYIKRNGRLPDGLPARPLNGQQKLAYQLLSGDTSAMRDLWLRAMGLGETQLKLRNGRLTWTTPEALRLMGLAPSISKNVSGGSFNALGLVNAKVAPGPFNLNFGKPSITGSRVKVSYTATKGSSVGAVTLRHKTFNGGWQEFFKKNARLSKNLSGSVYYKFTPAGPVIDTVSLGNATISLSSFPTPNVPGIGSAVSDIRGQVTSRLKKLAGSALPIRHVFDQAAVAGKKNLLKVVKADAAQYGFSKIDRIASVSINGGKLQVKVGGYKIQHNLPQLPQPAALSSTLKKYETKFRAPKRRQRTR